MRNSQSTNHRFINPSRPNPGRTEKNSVKFFFHIPLWKIFKFMVFRLLENAFGSQKIEF